MADGNVVVPFFYIQAVEDPAASKAAGRPIFVDQEFVEYRFAGNRFLNLHFPAHAMHERVDGEDITHAMRWPAQYAEFKQSGVNQIAGTPLEELTFLTNAERSELKALKIYTAEALAQMDGPTLKVLAGKGYRYKEQAEAYLNQSNGAAGVAKLVAEMEAMRAELAALKAEPQAPYTPEAAPDDGDLRTDDELREAIRALNNGKLPQGRPSRKVLQGILRDLEAAQDQAA